MSCQRNHRRGLTLELTSSRPMAIRPNGIGLYFYLKEFPMNEQSKAALEPQVVDLGDAKTLTKGFPDVVYAEDNPTIQGRLEA